MAPPSMVGAVAGGYLSGVLLDDALLVSIGALLGARLTGRLSERQLLRAIGAMLVLAGATTALQALW